MKVKTIYTLLAAMLLSLVLAACGGTGMESTSGSKSAIKAALVGGELQVSVQSDDQSNPRVVYMPDKQLYFAVWDDYRNRNTTGADIYGQFIKGDGTMCGSNFLISKDGAGALAGNQTLPDVAYRQDMASAANSNLVVIWQDSVGTTSGGYLRFVNLSGLPDKDTCGQTATVSAPVNMNYNGMQFYSATNTSDMTATVTINPGGGSGTIALTPYVVPGSVRVTGSFIKTKGVAPDPDVTVTVNGQDDSTGLINGSGLEISTATDINYSTGSLTFILNSSVDSAAEAATMTVTYKTYGSSPVPNNETLLSRKSPRISYDPNRDEFWATWVESRNTNNYASVLCFGAPFTWGFGDNNFIGYAKINKNGTSFNTSPLGGVSGADLLRNEPQAGHRTFLNRMTARSSTATIIEHKFEFFTQVNSPTIASDPTSPETFLVFEGISKTGTLTCNKNLDTGIITSTWSDTPTNGDFVHIYGIFDKAVLLANTFSAWIDFENTASGTNPAVVVDDASNPRKFLVAWEDMRDGPNTKIYGQLINSGGGRYNNNRIISYQDSAGSGENDAVIVNSRQTRPTASYDPVNQRYFVMWQDERNSSASLANIDLYGQNVNLDGSLSGANYAISSFASNQLAPAIAYDPLLKQFLAVWKDARNINPPGTTASDIYGQLFNIGMPQMTLLTATTPAAQLVPAVHDFKAVNTGTTVTWNFVVKNTGDATLTIDKVTALPANPFTVSPTNAATLAPGSSATYTVTFLPTAAGTYNSSFTLSSNGGIQAVALSGTGVGVNDLGITTPSTATFPDAPITGTYSVQMIAAGGQVPYSWSMSGAPAGLSINPANGLITGSNLPPGNYTVTVTVTDGTSPTAQTSRRSFSLRVGAMSITSAVLSTWTQGVEYNAAPVHSLTASGGTGAITWAVLTGSLPAGITLSNSGSFSGAATSNGTFNFTVLATDAINQTAQAPFNMTINPAPNITTTSLATATVGVVYTQVLDKTGGTAPVTWALTGGLPPGLSFNPALATISGTPTQSGSYALTFTITDAAGAVHSKTMNLAVNASLGIATPVSGDTAPPPTVVGNQYSFTLTTNGGGVAPYTWKVVSGALPAGLTLAENTGVISGSATAAGTTNAVISVTDSMQLTAQKTFTITVLAPAATADVKLVGAASGTVDTVTTVQTSTLTNLPAGFSASSAVQMKVSNVASGSTVLFAVTFPITLSDSSVFYKKLSDNTWAKITPVSRSGNTIFYYVKDRVADTGTLDDLEKRDLNPAPGIIEDPIVVGTVSSTGGSTGGTVSSSGGGGGGCFIATAAFGSYLDPHVMVLRHFRDNVLLQSGPGTAFVNFYYKYSPPIADFIAQHDTLRTLVRFALTPLIVAVKYPLLGLVLFALFSAGLFRLVRRRFVQDQQVVTA